jgi:alpha 1,3-glucosidase
MVLSWGVAGMVYSGSDVGGFFDNAGPALLARWFQVGAWLYPFFRCHSHHLSNRRELYTLQGEFFEVARDAIVDRYRLLPYWYTLARHANQTGEPLVRALWWEFPEHNLSDIEDHAMLGSALLVVPFLAEAEEPQTVQLPAGARWYCYRTLQEVREREVDVEFNHGRTQVFVRGGSVLPSKRRIRRSSTLMFWDPYVLTVALDNKGKALGELYIDDGESYDYVKGAYIHRRFVFDGDVFQSNESRPAPAAQFVHEYDVPVELIQIAGLPRTPKRIVDKKRGELRFKQAGGVVAIIRPLIPIREDFHITFEY